MQDIPELQHDPETPNIEGIPTDQDVEKDTNTPGMGDDDVLMEDVPVQNDSAQQEVSQVLEKPQDDTVDLLAKLSQHKKLGDIELRDIDVDTDQQQAAHEVYENTDTDTDPRFKNTPIQPPNKTPVAKKTGKGKRQTPATEPLKNTEILKNLYKRNKWSDPVGLKFSPIDVLELGFF